MGRLGARRRAARGFVEAAGGPDAAARAGTRHPRQVRGPVTAPKQRGIMTRTWIITALALAGAAPRTLVAQRPEPAPRARTPRPDGRAYTFSFNGSHGRIGVLVNTVADSSDRYGARTEGVTPGGPAEKAGLKAGDIITKFNGTSLAR